MKKSRLLGAVCTCLISFVLTAFVPTTGNTAYLIIEGYDGFNGTPQGGTIGSVATGPVDPWIGSVAYTRVDGWNHSPRVNPSQYAAGGWAPGGYAGFGTDAAGWTSLSNANPGRYAYSFEGFVLSNVTYDTNFASPSYGTEYRTYVGPGTWSLSDVIAGTTVASGIVNSMELDVFYDPLGGFANPLITSRSVVTVQDDGGAFYDEMINTFGTNKLSVNAVAPNEPPLQSVNFGQPLDQQWGVFDVYLRLEPLVVPFVPELPQASSDFIDWKPLIKDTVAGSPGLEAINPLVVLKDSDTDGVVDKAFLRFEVWTAGTRTLLFRTQQRTVFLPLLPCTSPVSSNVDFDVKFTNETGGRSNMGIQFTTECTESGTLEERAAYKTAVYSADVTQSPGAGGDSWAKAWNANAMSFDNLDWDSDATEEIILNLTYDLPDKSTDIRTIMLDQSTGAVEADTRYKILKVQ